MTDLQKLIRLFSELGIGYSTEIRGKNTCVFLEVGKQKIDGYSGFMSHYFFDEEGKFVKVSIWE